MNELLAVSIMSPFYRVESQIIIKEISSAQNLTQENAIPLSCHQVCFRMYFFGYSKHTHSLSVKGDVDRNFLTLTPTAQALSFLKGNVLKLP